ncbi:MAG TPA: patatin-like phospholipase family protein [Azonexus sp.]|nr:patatin-like phospholipase family protein [Azonexus sp.]
MPSISRPPPAKRIAIACQGGGSHTAFTAGVLQSLLGGMAPDRYRIHGLSGTSGGALCAALAWTGLLEGKPELGMALLESFWSRMSTTQFADFWSDQWLLFQQRSRSFFGLPEVSPYLLPNSGQDFLSSMLKEHIPFARLQSLITAHSPVLMIGAVEVLSGDFTVFHSHPRHGEPPISVEALLASAAIPEMFRAVHIGEGVYWDGLFSQNPPIRGFLSGKESRDAKPDEIWVIQINPDRRTSEPKTSDDIDDRRNELAGNLSMKQELFFVTQINDWLHKKWLSAAHLKHVDVRFIPLELELDYASKLDRSPAFIQKLLAEGRRKGKDFLDQLSRETA